MVDIYSPAVLNRVVQDLKATRRPPFLLGRYRIAGDPKAPAG